MHQFRLSAIGRSIFIITMVHHGTFLQLILVFCKFVRRAFQSYNNRAFEKPVLSQSPNDSPSHVMHSNTSARQSGTLMKPRGPVESSSSAMQPVSSQQNAATMLLSSSFSSVDSKNLANNHNGQEIVTPHVRLC